MPRLPISAYRKVRSGVPRSKHRSLPTEQEEGARWGEARAGGGRGGDKAARPCFRAASCVRPRILDTTTSSTTMLTPPRMRSTCDTGNDSTVMLTLRESCASITPNDAYGTPTDRITPRLTAQDSSEHSPPDTADPLLPTLQEFYNRNPIPPCHPVLLRFLQVLGLSLSSWVDIF